MKLTIGTKIKYIGQHVQDKFGDIDFTVKSSTLFAKKLPVAMSNNDIMNQFAPTEVDLGDLANHITKISQGNLYLFYIKDNTNTTRPVFVFFASEDGCRIVSPNETEVPTWNAGVTLLSSTAI